MIDRTGVHETAVLHPDCEVKNSKIGAHTRVWQFASVIRGAKVGAECTIASCALIDGATLGDRCIVGHGAALMPGVRTASDVFVGPSVTFCNDVWPGTDKDGFDLAELLTRTVTTIEVRCGASIGAGAIVMPGIIIGEAAMIAAGAIVTRSVPAHHVLRRDGTIEEIDAARPKRRVRHAAW